MITVYVMGRCLTCWTASIVRLPVERHLPAAFKSHCDTCTLERQFAVTGQVVNTLSPATLRQIKSAQMRKLRVDWEQIPLVEALMPKDGPAPSPGAVSQFHKPRRSTNDPWPAKGQA